MGASDISPARIASALSGSSRRRISHASLSRSCQVRASAVDRRWGGLGYGKVR
ncbi:hypothetical protein ACFQ0X_16650 [Streptomyces rectiviolaceus]|uniref:hypothetical protein n=1 Tax=Streptomyces rectiviolaceus TaxID=332591 RepID=UPI003635EF9B